MRGLTQSEMIVLHLADAPGQWIAEWRLRGLKTRHGFIGDEAKKRCREFFAKGATTAKFEINCVVYNLERASEGKYATIRLVSSAAKVPKFRYELRNGVRYQVPNEQTLFG
jgi:hypothetical protein